MKAFFLLLAGFYALGFAGVLALNLAIGPVTPALSLARASVWPVWMLTGIPHGVRQEPD